MLGVQRTSVNPILQRLRADGLIDLGRSRLTLVDRAGLGERACECYESMRSIESDILSSLGEPPTERTPLQLARPDSAA